MNTNYIRPAWGDVQARLDEMAEDPLSTDSIQKRLLYLRRLLKDDLQNFHPPYPNWHALKDGPPWREKVQHEIDYLEKLLGLVMREATVPETTSTSKVEIVDHQGDIEKIPWKGSLSALIYLLQQLAENGLVPRVIASDNAFIDAHFVDKDGNPFRNLPQRRTNFSASKTGRPNKGAVIEKLVKDAREVDQSTSGEEART